MSTPSINSFADNPRDDEHSGNIRTQVESTIFTAEVMRRVRQWHRDQGLTGCPVNFEKIWKIYTETGIVESTKYSEPSHSRAFGSNDMMYGSSFNQKNDGILQDDIQDGEIPVSLEDDLSSESLRGSFGLQSTFDFGFYKPPVKKSNDIGVKLAKLIQNYEDFGTQLRSTVAEILGESHDDAISMNLHNTFSSWSLEKPHTFQPGPSPQKKAQPVTLPDEAMHPVRDIRNKILEKPRSHEYFGFVDSSQWDVFDSSHKRSPLLDTSDITTTPTAEISLGRNNSSTSACGKIHRQFGGGRTPDACDTKIFKSVSSEASQSELTNERLAHHEDTSRENKDIMAAQKVSKNKSEDESLSKSLV